MKLLSDAAEYALRSVVWFSQHPEQVLKVREVAEHTQAAPGYLVKVLQALAKAGILSTQRGSRGGFRLIRDPSSLSALEVINAVDPIGRIRTCPLGSASHGVRLCPLHRRIDDAIAQIEAGFRTTTIEDLLQDPTLSEQRCMALTPHDTAEADTEPQRTAQNNRSTPD